MIRSILTVTLFVRLAAAAAPAVTKVEPPDWPAGAKATTLRMLVTGGDFAGATVRSPLATAAVKSSAGGTHLFFDLTIPAGARPGSYPIELRTAGRPRSSLRAGLPARKPQPCECWSPGGISQAPPCGRR